MFYLLIVAILLAGAVVSYGVMCLFTNRKPLGIVLIIIGFIAFAVIIYYFNQPGVLGSDVVPNDAF